MKAFVSWSGGKETAMAFYKAGQDKSVEAGYLLNMVSEDGRYSRSHGVSAEVLKAQAEAIGVTIVQMNTSWGNYEGVFKKAILELKKDGIDTGIFGDIDLREHRDWVERVCEEIGIKPILPLWKREREDLLREFISLGFKAIVCATQASLLGKEWLGREIDEKFIEDIKAAGNVDLCGEKGEYHTFVFDGPLFKRAVKFSSGRKVLKDNHWFLELSA